MQKQFLCFILSGFIAAALNWGSCFVFSKLVSFELAIVFSFFVGLSSGFILMRFYVFEGYRKPITPQISKYIIVNLIALLQIFFISLILSRWLLPLLGIYEHTEALGHFVGVLAPILTSYFGHKFLTFR